MRKIIALLMVIAMMIPLATVASASTTTLTTTVPAAEYTLVIPRDTTVEFGASFTQLEPMVTVNNAKGFANGKDLSVTVIYDAFKCEGVSTTIPFKLTPNSDTNKAWESGTSIIFEGKSDGTVSTTATWGTLGLPYIGVKVLSDDWGKALAGTYTAVLTFSSEVVVDEA